MSEIDVLKDAAHKVLSVATDKGFKDDWFWQKAQRLRETSEMICKMPEITNQNLPVDTFCLIGAAYFCQAGPAKAMNKKHQAFANQKNFNDLLKNSSEITANKLSGVMTEPKIDKICSIIIESGNKNAITIEAKILSDARNLDDLGALGIANEVRKYAFQGKGIKDLLDGWQKRTDYGYWDALLYENIHFESVRQIAIQRMKTAKKYLQILNIENQSGDIKKPKEYKQIIN